MHVIANKGFSYQQVDQAYICQKKNHTELMVSLQQVR